MDARFAGRGEPGRRPDGSTGERRDHSYHAGTVRDQVATSQALAAQPRPSLRRKKHRRDRLIRLAETHPDWALGFQDETWWSRTAQPDLHAFCEPDAPLKLEEKVVPKTDPDPRASTPAFIGIL